ncbi:MAG: GTP 3',8-cyclase MoaA [Salinivirgaceae bacterium]
MYDCFSRKINYLRVSVTDRCNFRCTYCMPAEGVELLSHNDILSFDEIVETIKFGVSQGINKVRLTGGEPLVRKGIVNLVQMIRSIEGITDLSMTTNGVHLAEMAQALKDAGLQRVNISLDTLDPERFKQITRVGNLQDVLNGIEAAQKAGLTPIKLNCVVKNSGQEPDALMVTKFANENNLQVRYIHEMDLAKGTFSVVEGGDGGNCAICNRLRLTANGNIMPCLFSNKGYNIRELGIEEAYHQALLKKPKSGKVNNKGSFYNIGG